MKSYFLLAAGILLAGCMRADPVAPGSIVFLGDSHLFNKDFS